MTRVDWEQIARNLYESKPAGTWRPLADLIEGATVAVEPSAEEKMERAAAEAGYELLHKHESCGGYGDFAVTTFARRPAGVRAALDKLDRDARFNANWPLTQVGESFMAQLILQSRKLDPDGPRQVAAVRETFREAFEKAQLGPIYMEPIANGYWREESPEAIHDPWYRVTTPIGHFKVGWRKRVIALSWEDVPALQKIDAGYTIFAREDVTKGPTSIHAWGYEKLQVYLSALRVATIEGVR